MPKIDLEKFDRELIRNLAKIHCTNKEIANILKCSPDTIERHFMDELHAGRSEGKATLRRQMFKAVEKGNSSIMIFLAKNLLGMTDRPLLDDQDINKYSREEIERIANKALDFLRQSRKQDVDRTQEANQIAKAS